MLKQSDVIVIRDDHNGSYECSAMVNGYRASRVYYGYTKREAVRRFAAEHSAPKVQYEYAIQGYYQYGWETVCTEATIGEAKKQLRCYNENETQYPHRIKRVRSDNA